MLYTYPLKKNFKSRVLFGPKQRMTNHIVFLNFPIYYTVYEAAGQDKSEDENTGKRTSYSLRF